jgi:hypothetical protein
MNKVSMREKIKKHGVEATREVRSRERKRSWRDLVVVIGIANDGGLKMSDEGVEAKYEISYEREASGIHLIQTLVDFSLTMHQRRDHRENVVQATWNGARM